MTQADQQAPNDADVIIIGGGPAGVSTALHLQHIDPALARRCMLLEASAHPREKICGGAITLNTERLLAQLDVPVAVSYAPVRNVRLTYGRVAIELPEDGCAKKVIRRSEFDATLMQAAKDRGFAVIEGVRATKVVRHPDHLLVHTSGGSFRAKVVVGADGVGGVLRKTPGFSRGRRPSRLWVAEVPVDPRTAPGFQDQVIEVDLSYMRRGVKGYYWDFPCLIDGQPSASCGLVDANLDRGSRISGYRLLEEILAERGMPIDQATRKAFPMRYFSPRDTFAQPRMLLVGDALGSDPLFSEGISQALSYGELAAAAISDAFRREDLSFARYQKQVLNSRVGRELRMYVLMARCLYGWNVEFFLSALREDATLRDLIGHSYAGTADLHRSRGDILRCFVRHSARARSRIERLRRDAGFRDPPGGTPGEPPEALINEFAGTVDS